MNSLVSATFHKKTNRFELKFGNGLTLEFPVTKIEGLKNQPHQEIEKFSTVNRGSVLEWKELDLRVGVKTLCEDLLGGL